MVEQIQSTPESQQTKQRVHFEFPTPACEELLMEYCELNHNHTFFDPADDTYEFNLPLPAEIIFSLNGKIIREQQMKRNHIGH